MQIKLTLLLLLAIHFNQAQVSLRESSDEPLFEDINKDEKEEKNDNRTSRSALKLNLTQLILTNPTIQYEFAFHNNISVAASFAYLIPKKIPNMIWEQDNSGIGWKNGRFDGMAGILEARFYPGKKEEYQAPHGFYVAPYYKYSKYTLTADYLQKGIGTSPDRELGVKGSFSGYIIGLATGAQFIINKHFSVDIWIYGMGFGKGKLVTELTSKDGLPLVVNETYNDVLQRVEQLGKFGKGDVSLEVTENKAVLEVGGLPKSNFRILGICLGYAF